MKVAAYRHKLLLDVLRVSEMWTFSEIKTRYKGDNPGLLRE